MNGYKHSCIYVERKTEGGVSDMNLCADISLIEKILMRRTKETSV